MYIQKKLQKPTLLPHHESYKHASRSAQYVSSYRPVSRVEWSGERLQIVKKLFLLSVGDVRGDGTGSSILGDRGFGFLLYFIFIVWFYPLFYFQFGRFRLTDWLTLIFFDIIWLHTYFLTKNLPWRHVDLVFELELSIEQIHCFNKTLVYW